MPDNIEKFAYIYELDEKPIQGAIGKAEDSISNFVNTATGGFDSVVGFAKDTFSSLLQLGGRGVANALDSLGFSIKSQTYLIATAQEAMGKFLQVYEVGKGILGSFGQGLKGVGKRFGMLTENMEQGARSSFQMENRLGGVMSILKFIGKVGGLGILLGPLLPLIKPFMAFVNVLSNTLMPAIEVITDTLETALSPVAAALQDLALRFVPVLLKLLEPVVDMLLQAIGYFDAFISEMDFEPFFGMFEELLPLIKEIADSFVQDFLKPVGGVLFRTVIKLFMSLVKVAVQFVKTIKPYLPTFFSLLAQIAELIITTLGDALDELLVGVAEILRSPDFITLIQDMLDLFKELLTAVQPLVKPLTEIFVRVLAKFLLPGMIVILDELTKGMIELLKESKPTIEAFAEWLEGLAEWWRDHGDEAKVFWDSFREGAEAVIPVIKEVIGFVTSLLGKIAEAIGLLVEMRREAGEREEGREQELQIARQQANLRLQQRLHDEQTERLIQQFREAGRTEEQINELRARRKIQRVVLASQVEIAKLRLRELEGRAEGGYELVKRPVIVAEKGPEWIVPDTAEGIAKYVPMMLRSVIGKTGAGTGRVELDMPMGTRRVEDVLVQIRNLLQNIEENLQSDTSFLPETL